MGGAAPQLAQVRILAGSMGREARLSGLPSAAGATQPDGRRTVIEPCWTLPELKKRGWSDRLIRELLGEPDEIKRSLHFWKAPPMQLYVCDRVIAAESDLAFVAYQESRAKRSAASKATAERKRVERRPS